MATIRIAAVGDLMFNGIPASKENQKQFLADVAPILAKADIAFANLEIPLTDVGMRTPHKSAAAVAAKKQFILRADPAWAGPIAKAGFDVVSIANNHAGDYSGAGIARMIRALDENKVRHAGAGTNLAAASQMVVLTKNGIRVAFIAYLAFRTPGGLAACTPATAKSAGVNALHGSGAPAAKANLSQAIQAARKKADFVVVSFHWGIERRTMPDPYQVSLGRMAIDLGADMVLGHHPHVLQPYELYKGRPIYYSLGNFVAPKNSGRLGETVIFETVFDRNGLRGIHLTPVRIGPKGPKVLTGDKKQAALNHISRSVQLLKGRK